MSDRHMQLLSRVKHVSLMEPRGAPLGEEGWVRSYAGAVRTLRSAGFSGYEISHFARRGCRSRQILHAYGAGDLIGIGPGARSRIGPLRFRNVAGRGAYVERVLGGASPRIEAEMLDERAVARERLLLGIRLTRGVSKGMLRKAMRPEGGGASEKVLCHLEKAGLIRVVGDRFFLTDSGMLVADAVGLELLS
jgi:oxygen-independent coproporphyrinogen-3 oxidase